MITKINEQVLFDNCEKIQKFTVQQRQYNLQIMEFYNSLVKLISSLNEKISVLENFIVNQAESNDKMLSIAQNLVETTKIIGTRVDTLQDVLIKVQMKQPLFLGDG